MPIAMRTSATQKEERKIEWRDVVQWMEKIMHKKKNILWPVSGAKDLNVKQILFRVQPNACASAIYKQKLLCCEWKVQVEAQRDDREV